MPYSKLYGYHLSMGSLTIFSVATDRYLEHWINLVRSSSGFTENNLSVQWILFTNREGEIPSDIKLNMRDMLLIKPVESLIWPMPTLLRYKLLSNVSDEITGEIILYLDADMLFANSVSLSDLTNSIGNNKISLVKHPGYFRPRSISRIRFYAFNPIFILKDIKLRVMNGSLGTWEKNSKSCAYVPRNQRKEYVCGGAWFGNKDAIIEMCELLSERVEIDLSKGIIAKFHDESHLNWYSVTYNCSISDPSFCFEPTYPQLFSIKPKIIAVNKAIDLRLYRK